jgi:hypothetical protein
MTSSESRKRSGVRALTVLAAVAAGCGDSGSTTGGGQGAGGAATASSASAAGGGGEGGAAPTAGEGGGGGNPDPCDLVPQDCLIDPASKCAIDLSPREEPTARCTVPLGDDVLGEACERPGDQPGEDTCAAGLYCTDLEARDPGELECATLCENEDDCDQREVCVAISELERLVGVCADACEPLATGACEPHQSCSAWRNLEGEPRFFCARPGESGEGEDCDASGVCGADLACASFDPDEPSTCRAFCSDEVGCDGDAECHPLTELGGEGFGDLGVCG